MQLFTMRLCLFFYGLGICLLYTSSCFAIIMAMHTGMKKGIPAIAATIDPVKAAGENGSFFCRRYTNHPPSITIEKK